MPCFLSNHTKPDNQSDNIMLSLVWLFKNYFIFAQLELFYGNFENSYSRHPCGWNAGADYCRPGLCRRYSVCGVWMGKQGRLRSFSALQSPSGSTRTHAASSKRKQQSQIPVSSFGRGSQTILLIHLSGSDIQFHLHPVSWQRNILTTKLIPLSGQKSSQAIRRVISFATWSILRPMQSFSRMQNNGLIQNRIPIHWSRQNILTRSGE